MIVISRNSRDIPLISSYCFFYLNSSHVHDGENTGMRKSLCYYLGSRVFLLLPEESTSRAPSAICRSPDRIHHKDHISEGEHKVLKVSQHSRSIVLVRR